ncbi:MAG TPA: glycosyl hydrolase family 28-related protein [Allosphingosinicella sp.]|jgi:hypothetical protein
MSVSILSYIPSGQHAAIAAGTSTYDASADFQTAINAVNAAGGGTLYIPAGKYRLNSTITNKPKVCLLGDGVGSVLEWASTHTGHGIQQLAPLNASTPVHTVIEKISLYSLAGSSSTGGAFYERGGTSVQLLNCAIGEFKYGIILDQSELVDIDLCDIYSSRHSCIWLVNGAEAALGNTGAQGGYTNRISVKRCQLNGPGQFAILDDGGYTHSFVDNNYNGGTTHIRAAGAEGLVIQGGEFEAASSRNIYLTYTSLSGVGVGRCMVVLVAGAVISPTTNNNCIETVSAGHLTLIGNLFANSGNTAVGAVSCGNTNMLFSVGNVVEGIQPLFQGGPNYLLWAAEAQRMGSATANVGSIPAGGSAFVNVPIDISVGDAVDHVFTSVDLGDDITLSARVSATNNVRVKLTNTGAAAVDPPSCTYWVRAIKNVI